MAGVIATMVMQRQVKSQRQQYAEKLTENSHCLSVDLETQPLVPDFLIHDHKTLQVPKILWVKWQNLKIASLSNAPDSSVSAQTQSSEEREIYLQFV